MTRIFILFFCFVNGVVLQETSDGKQCGLLSSDTSSNPSHLPWHASIYTKKRKPYMQLCGGTLVSDKVVISVAHCFWDQAARNVHPASDYAVALGKLHRQWDSIDDHAQKSDLESIKVPPRFQGPNANFQEDIALLVLTVPATINSFVKPVCLDFDKTFEKSQLQAGKFGKTVVWGNPDLKQALRTVDLPYLPIGECITEAPISFREYITGDKICVKISNESILCKGDSGIGVSFPQENKSYPGQIQYFFRGVMSVAEQKNPEKICDFQDIGLLTQITRHEEFIKYNII